MIWRQMHILHAMFLTLPGCRWWLFQLTSGYIACQCLCWLSQWR